jgi:hypothetical protein
MSVLQRNCDYYINNVERVFSAATEPTVMLTLKDPNGFTPRIEQSNDYGCVYTNNDMLNINQQKVWYTFRLLGVVGSSYVIDIF